MKLPAALAIGLLVLATAVRAETNCALVQMASFPISITPSGTPAIQIAIDGVEKPFGLALDQPQAGQPK